MRFAIVGAGATGGFLGARLARAGEEVTLIARGAHLEAMRARGIRVIGAEGEFSARPECTDDLSAIRGAEVVVMTLKAHQLPPLAETLGAALDPRATVVSAQNGLPWWYFEDRVLESVDPGGVVSRAIPRARVVACVVYPATELAGPGVVRHVEGSRFSLGEPDGSRSKRALALSEVLIRAGLKAPVTARIRQELWLKLLGNATFNPVSALTGASLGRLATDAGGKRLIGSLMAEVAAVAEAVGVELPLSIEKRIAGAAEVGEHKTSMLQDVEAGKATEIDALVGSVVEVAGWHSVPVPGLEAVYRLVKLLEAAKPWSAGRGPRRRPPRSPPGR